ncbi:hypothetical protein K438DRAFT_1749515 [Mycena galopus ATCC 62051]|nr:hypothetical protein K438DRAFT_1749515 [Mycena galopus ATCC 62051]
MAALVIVARASTLTRPPTCTSAATYARGGSTRPQFGHGHSFASGAAESRAGVRKGRVDEPDFEAAQGPAPMTADELVGMRPSSASWSRKGTTKSHDDKPASAAGAPRGRANDARGRGVFAQACSAARMWTFHYERMRKMPLSRDVAEWVDLKRRITWGKLDEASVVRKIEAAPAKNQNKESGGGDERERGRRGRQREGDRAVTATSGVGSERKEIEKGPRQDRCTLASRDEPTPRCRRPLPLTSLRPCRGRWEATERERRGEGGENANDGKHRAAHVHHARHAPRRSSAWAWVTWRRDSATQDAAGERVHLSKESREAISKETEAWMGLLLGRRACLPMHQALSEQKEQLAEGSLRWGAKPDLLADASKGPDGRCRRGTREQRGCAEGTLVTQCELLRTLARALLLKLFLPEDGGEAKIERDKDPRVQLLAGRADGDAGAGQVSDTL